MNDQYI